MSEGVDERREQVHLNGRRQLRAPADAVWATLFDPKVLCHCIPGCQRMQHIDDEHYVASLDVPIPLLSGEYKALIGVTEQLQPVSCRLTLESNTRFGAVRASGWLSLSGDGHVTTVSFDGDLDLGRFTSGGGVGIGGRLLAAPARAMLDRFFLCLESNLAKGQTGP